ncbi:type 1 glutamine amidotransferase [Sphingomonas sp. HDW15A]|uniref:type 1 glutamine amidotransferase domain-containing protein n=1 Tax=Sphingomonas sp. HDW15A TaxID=2714942 RepID=UPI00140A44AF|nr:type 1 glutamine amidotransferase domain-containing protein [Sphingomonas sp. HDW15A]QIK96298.1 type 1 glutamine amidotransferase [Sphingomonas sp. HDW15A]
MNDLTGRHVLIMATDRFEESELFGPRERLLAAGARVSLASIEKRPIQATVHDEPGKTIAADIVLAEVNPADYDALLLPGGVGNPDRLRMESEAIAIIRKFHFDKKPVAAICHGPWLLAEADIVRGRTVTCWPSIRTDLRNAGATVIDEEAVTDGNLITSRNPDDVPAFTEALILALKS